MLLQKATKDDLMVNQTPFQRAEDTRKHGKQRNAKNSTNWWALSRRGETATALVAGATARRTQWRRCKKNWLNLSQHLMATRRPEWQTKIPRTFSHRARLHLSTTLSGGPCSGVSGELGGEKAWPLRHLGSSQREGRCPAKARGWAARLTEISRHRRRWDWRTKKTPQKPNNPAACP